MNSRTIRDFNVPTDIRHRVEKWAETEGFRLLDDDGTKRRYQKGHGLLVLPTMFEISIIDGDVHFEAWIHASMFHRIFSFFLFPENIWLESGGLLAVIPRTISRDAVNRLLVQIGQPLIA